MHGRSFIAENCGVMSEYQEALRTAAGRDRQSPRMLGIFVPWRLRAYGYTLAALYAGLLLYNYQAGSWLLNVGGVPIYVDFTMCWVAASQALHGTVTALYVPAEFAKLQDAVVGTGHGVASIWAYPPIFLLILGPLALLPYCAAFLIWDVATLLGYTVTIGLIVRRSPAVALALALPFTARNIALGQNGLLAASLLGAGLLLLERRPALAGMFIGLLSFKPQLGVLFPVALVASRNWRAFASAAATIALLAGGSIATFGTSVWIEFPPALLKYSTAVLLGDSDKISVFGNITSDWGQLQTIYGLVRDLYGSGGLAWLAQGLTTIAVSMIVWYVWRCPVRYALKAVTLSVAVLLATPYAYNYDFAATGIAVAFLARDQICCGLLRSEQTVTIALFAASLMMVFASGIVPLGPFITIMLLVTALRRVLHALQPAALPVAYG